MSRDELEKYLTKSAVARKAKVPVRVVFRREQMTTGAMGRAIESGEMCLGRESTCDLVAGGVLVAKGEIVEHDGAWFFRAKENKR